MSAQDYNGIERRKFVRLDYIMPFAYKVCNKTTISRLLEGYVSNISEAGLFCKIKDKVDKDDVLWLSFDKGTLDVCQELEKRSLIYQNGIIGKVIRAECREDGAYNVGVQFITREEKSAPGSYFSQDK